MRLLCISDIHDQFGDYKVSELPDADIVLIAGDLTDWGHRGEARGYGELNRARTWLREMGERYSGVFWIPGNHDIGVTARTFEDIPNVLCVLNQTIRIGGLSLRGVSQTVCFDQPSLKRTWDYMTDNKHADFLAFDFPPVDIVLSHGPPGGVLDGPGHWGSPAFRSRLMDNPSKLVVCGHIHEDGGRQERVGDTLVVNCACVPMVVELEGAGEILC